RPGLGRGHALLSVDAAVLPAGSLLHLRQQRHQASLSAGRAAQSLRLTGAELEAQARHQRPSARALSAGALSARALTASATFQQGLRVDSPASAATCASAPARRTLCTTASSANSTSMGLRRKLFMSLLLTFGS